jgi:mono/diheme cytochrome c family protein
MKLPSARLIVLLATFFAVLHAQDARLPSGSTADPAASTQGKAIFVSHGCAKCHDDDANKKLPDGTTLLARLRQNKDPEARLGTRLKNPQERHQVMVYMQSLFERQASAQTGAKPH